MEFDEILEVVIAAVAYGILWGLTLYNRKVVEEIARRGLKTLREIRRELRWRRK